MANVYKTFTNTDLANKSTYTVSETENQNINTIVSTFVSLFKTKHLG